MTSTTSREPDLEDQLERYRRELTAYAYRMLGSSFEAEDAVQEAFLRAWKSYDTFEQRASLRSWLYTITTNVCLDMLGGKERRARPMDLGPARAASTELGEPLPEVTWIGPVPDGRVVPADGDPAAPPAEAASGAHPPGGPRLEGSGGRRAPGHERRVGQ
jgi:RNA polymerase sigma-70 factor, ECF subfamily